MREFIVCLQESQLYRLHGVQLQVATTRRRLLWTDVILTAVSVSLYTFASLSSPASPAHSCFFPVLWKTFQFITSKKKKNQPKNPDFHPNLGLVSDPGPASGCITRIRDHEHGCGAYARELECDLRDCRGVDRRAYRKNPGKQSPLLFFLATVLEDGPHEWVTRKQNIPELGRQFFFWINSSIFLPWFLQNHNTV